jgi:trigger factor
MLMQSAYQLQQQGIDVRQLFNQDTLPRLKESSRPEAENRLKRTMALGEIAKQQKLEVSAAELNDKIKETMEDLGGQQVDPERLRSVLSEELLKEKILAWVEENSTIELVEEGSLKPAEDADDEPAAKKSDKKAKADADVEEQPKADKKAGEKPKADKPKADKKADEKPKADKPKADKKADEKPKSDKPKADKKADEKPKADKKAPSKKKS